MADRRAYYAERRKRLAAEKASGKAKGCHYPSLAWCLSLTDEQVAAEYQTHGLTLPELRLYDDGPFYIPELGGHEPTEQDIAEYKAAGAERQRLAHHQTLRTRLFIRSVKTHVATLDNKVIVERLNARDPDILDGRSRKFIDEVSADLWVTALYSDEVEEMEKHEQS